MNRNAANALLARVYLFMQDYEKAKYLAIEVVNNVPLMTIDEGYPDAIFRLRFPNNTEALFQLSPSIAAYLNYYLRSDPVRLVATSDLSNILKADTNDIRSSWVSSTPNGWMVAKFPINSAPEANPSITIPEIAYYPVMLRSSEMVLIVAEAAAKTNDENTARSYLNTLRKRANPTVSDIIATGQELIDSIYKERRKELAFEGLRLFDLLRWKKGIDRIDVLPGSNAHLPYPSDKAITPIPVDEIRLAGISQNPSY
jgi:starch-binding outer membrane protein, SusD/RagB family